MCFAKTVTSEYKTWQLGFPNQLELQVGEADMDPSVWLLITAMPLVVNFVDLSFSLLVWLPVCLLGTAAA